MDNLWTRRSNTSKLSLSTNGGLPAQDYQPRNYTSGRRTGDISSHSTKNPFNSMSPASISSPTAGASSAFGLGSGAFASFGTSSKTPKTSGGVLDFGSVVGGLSAKTPTVEKSSKELGTKSSKTSLGGSKTDTPPPRHHLRHNWVFWFKPPTVKQNGHGGADYEKTIHAIAGFDSVEEFFRVYSHLKHPSALSPVSDYHLFKKGVRPIWEDEENRSGGKWIVRLKKGVADRYWEELVFALIGDQFAEVSEEICGAVLSVRSGEDILSVWTRNTGGRVLKIKERLRTILAFPQDTRIDWKSHDDSIQQRTAVEEHRKDKTGQHALQSPATTRGSNPTHATRESDASYADRKGSA